MENQTKTNNNKKTLAIIVALLVVAVAVVAVFVNRGQPSPVDEATATPETVVTDAPEATDEPEATEEPATEEPATEEPATEEPATEEPATEEPAATEEPVAAEEQAAAVTDEPETAEASAQGNPEDVMMLVNGTAVTRKEVEDYEASLTSYFTQQGYDMTNEVNLRVVGAIALDTAIEDEILDQKIVDLGLELTDEERAQAAEDNAEEWANAVDAYAQYYFGMTEESTEEEAADARLNAVALLESMGYTESVMLDSALENQRFEKIYAYMVQDAEVSDAEIQAAFDAHVAEDQESYGSDVAYYEFMTQYYGYPSYYTPEGYRGVTHILLAVDEELLNNWKSLTAQLEEQQDEAEVTDEETTDEEATGEDAGEDAEPTAEPVTQEQVDAAYAAIIASVQPTIDEIYAKLEAGTPFADLVAEYGTDPGMTVEPTMTEGYAVHMDSILWDPAFVTGAFSVDEVGAVAQPVVGSYGVHIIQYTRDIPAGPVEMTEELHAEILDELISDKESELYRQTMDAWVAEAEIVYSDEAQAMRVTEEASEE